MPMRISTTLAIPPFRMALLAAVAGAAGASCVFTAVAAEEAKRGPPSQTSPAAKVIPKGDDPQIDEGAWLCRPAEFCQPSSVAGECIPLKEGVKCTVSKGPPADR